MRENNSKFDNSFYDDDQPSCFVVDLKKQLEECEPNNYKKDFYDKLKEFKRSSNIEKSVKFNLPTKALKKVYKKHENKLDQLAIFFLLKYIFLFVSLFLKLFHKLCYATGWSTVFIVRFIYFSFLFTLKQGRILIIKLKPQLSKLSFKIKLDGLRQFGQILNRKSQPAKLVYSTMKKSEILTEDSEKLASALPTQIKTRKKIKFRIKNLLPRPNRTLLKPAFTFTIILFILVLPFKALTYYKYLNPAELKGKVLGITETAINELTQAGSSVMDLEFGQASQSFSSASNNFLKARDELREVNNLLFVLASYLPNEDFKLAANAKYILTAGQTVSELGKELSLAMDSLFKSDLDLINILDKFSEHGAKAASSAGRINEQLSQINISELPAEYQEQFIFIRERTVFLEKSLTEFVDLIYRTQLFLGINQDKRYLLVFQNNTEMRASGGFIGSYALIDFSDGKLKNIEAPGGGSYDTEAGLYERIIAPEPLHLVNALWHFWDANWWPDWSKSAKKLEWFYEKSNGPTVDGVISFTPTVIEKILSSIGPIDMTEDYGVVIDSENFWLTTQTFSEQKEEETKEPKKIIGDLMNKIIEELPGRLNKETLIKLIVAIEQSLNEKHILFYFSDEELQQKATDLGWDGRIKQTNWDYLMVVNTNIAGGKSDKKIIEEINHSAEVLNDGTIINTVEIKRTHTGIKREPFSGVRNVNWLRVYVPIGSELIEADGFNRPDEIYFEEPDQGWQADPDLYLEEVMSQTHLPSGTKIYDESWKTVFANWTMVDPGETITAYFKYKLPFKLDKDKKTYNIVEQIENYLNPDQKLLYPYALLVQKQPGSVASQINSSLKLPNNFNIIWQYPEELNLGVGGWDISDSLEVDKYWAVILESE